MGSTSSTDMDHVVHLIRILFWNMITGSQLLTHIPGKLNEEADIESRKHEARTEWMINRKYFEKIIKSLNFKPTVDLFATRRNT